MRTKIARVQTIFSFRRQLSCAVTNSLFEDRLRDRPKEDVHVKANCYSGIYSWSRARLAALQLIFANHVL